MSDLDIRKIRKILKLTQGELAEKLGVHYKTIQNWEKGGVIPESKMTLIRSLGLSDYEKIEAYAATTGEPATEKKPIKEAEGGYLAGRFSNLAYLLPLAARSLEINRAHFLKFGAGYEKIQSPVKGADFATVLSADGLGPEFPDGSIAYFKQIDPDLFIEWGKVHAVSTPNGLIIKRLNPGSLPGTLLCSSADPRFKAFEIPRKSPDMHFYRAVACTVML